jgi:hypothetical protein
MTKYGMPFFLEDKTGLLTGSDFIDLHDRMGLTYRRSAQDATRTAYMIYDLASSRRSAAPMPLAVLDFGSNNSLGTIIFPADGRRPSMKDYLSKLSTLSLYVTFHDQNTSSD